MPHGSPTGQSGQGHAGDPWGGFRDSKHSGQAAQGRVQGAEETLRAGPGQARTPGRQRRPRGHQRGPRGPGSARLRASRQPVSVSDLRPLPVTSRERCWPQTWLPRLPSLPFEIQGPGGPWGGARPPPRPLRVWKGFTCLPQGQRLGNPERQLRLQGGPPLWTAFPCRESWPQRFLRETGRRVRLTYLSAGRLLFFSAPARAGVY